MSNTFPPMTFLFECFQGPIKMAVLSAALELDLARVLETGLSALNPEEKAQGMRLEDLARALDIRCSSEGLAFFLNAAVSMGLVKKKDGRYANTAFARFFLDSHSTVFMGGLVKNMVAMQHRNLDQMAAIIRNGPPEKGELLESEAKWEEATAHLTAYQRVGMAELAADLVQALPEFDTATKLLDIGGGPGLIGMEILRRRPGMTGVLADMPAVIAQAQKEVEKEGMAGRISYIAGDYNEMELGSGYDIIWASHTLYYVKQPDRFYANLKACLTDDGVLICLHEGLTQEKTAPAGVVLSRLSLALEGQDVSFEKGEIAAHLQKAGFAFIETRFLDLPAGQGELVVARKGHAK